MSKEGNHFEKAQRGQFVCRQWLSTRSSELYNCGFWRISISSYLISDKWWFKHSGSIHKVEKLQIWEHPKNVRSETKPVRFLLIFFTSVMCKMRSTCQLVHVFIQTTLQSLACTHFSISCPNETWTSKARFIVHRLRGYGVATEPL